VLVTFDVFGTPAPQGSTRAFVVGNRAVTTNKGTPGQMAWRDSVAQMAHTMAQGLGDDAPMTGALRLAVTFRFPMPASRSKAVRALGEAPKTTAPDLDKLIRSVGDALQAGGLVQDDARFSTITASKVEVTGWTGATIRVSRETGHEL
jgi:Holliday junction resolvase RusA-like endonuclease